MRTLPIRFLLSLAFLGSLTASQVGHTVPAPLSGKMENAKKQMPETFFSAGKNAAGRFSVPAPGAQTAILLTRQDNDASHQLWDELLKEYVSDQGKVNYKGLRKEKSKLEQYLNHLADNPVQSDWSRYEKMAYWINAYNAFTVNLILDNYPLSSIMDLAGGKVWDVKKIKLGARSYTLNQIEHEMLRAQFQDPRIHFAVNCAAKSCPPLHDRAFTGANLDTLLDRLAREFINHPAYNSISPQKVEISKVFEWYAEDFGNIIDYLNQYAETDIRPEAEVVYREYDWALNDQ